MNFAFIPVRGGSKSIPGKNIKPFCGKPLIWWNLSQLEECSLIDEVIVATDDEQIKQVALSFGFKKVRVYDRESVNAQDKSSTESVMLEFLEKSKYSDNDTFVLVQVTSPFTTSQHFLEAFEQLKRESADSLLTATTFKRFIWKRDGTALNYDFKNRPRRQDFEGLLLENGSFYISKVGDILKSKNRLSGKISVYEMTDPRTSIEIDDAEDWIMAESLMKKSNHQL